MKNDFYDAWLKDDAALDTYKGTPNYKSFFGSYIDTSALTKQFQSVYKVVCHDRNDYTGAKFKLLTAYSDIPDMQKQLCPNRVGAKTEY